MSWAALHEQAVEAFAKGWRRPEPHAWDGLLAPDIELTQPLLRCGRGRQLWQREIARLLAFLPDLHGEVLDWAGAEERLFIQLRLTATLGGKPLSFVAVDRLRLDPNGVAVARESFFDPAPVAAMLARRPSTWLPWWRSGLGPLLGRRKFLSDKEKR
ncbi:nuclear transport factor 2 family protein [Sciscionella sediminilitoris]|uniref:nuclear transport factor 2 family protein n=1 Tax=Sciscionella sediminilitoris TaxID=1445613 RepID=UPI0004DFB639|nr:nuclear transport factor 2 family protein [Sciscionella sp. SE31]